MTLPASLATLPTPVQAVLNLVDDLDQCFRVGFANLEPSHQVTLHAWQRIFNGTPLQQAGEEAIAALQQYEFSKSHFAVIARLRAALQGAIFDQLQYQARSELGRTTIVAVTPQSSTADVPSHLQPLLESICQWLMEVALIGFTRLDTSTLMPFTTTLEKLQAEPLLIRQSALLTGLFNELMSKRSSIDSNNLPVCRWVDLWTRATIGARSLPLQGAKPVSGTLELLGINLQQHAHLVSLVAYGLLTVDGQPQFTRLTLSAYKVDAIQMDEIWLLFPQAVTLLDAFAQTKKLRLNEVLMLPTGDLLLPEADLLLSGKGTVGGKYNLMERAAEYFAVGASGVPATCWLHPCDRHPVQLAEPIFLKGYTVQSTDSLTLHWKDTPAIPIAIERLGRMSTVTAEAIAASSELFGLLRFDAGRWAVQPLVVTVGKKTIATGQTAAKVLKSPPKTSTVGILQERASRLLRQ